MLKIQVTAHRGKETTFTFENAESMFWYVWNDLDPFGDLNEFTEHKPLSAEAIDAAFNRLIEDYKAWQIIEGSLQD